MASYGDNLKICGQCIAVSPLIRGWEEVIRIRDEYPDFNHIHSQDGQIVAFNSRKRKYERELMTIKDLQDRMKPWTVEPHFANNADPCFMLKHALFHATKATGKIAGLADEHDHSGAKAQPTESFKESAKYLADLVICAMKMSSEAGIDLGAMVEGRMIEKGLL